MNPGLAGLGSAFSWGVADFSARFIGRKIGTDRMLLAVLGASVILMAPLVWSSADFSAFARFDVALTLMFASAAALATLWMLYETLGRGPLSIVVPIMACNPVPLVLWSIAFQGLTLSSSLMISMLLTLAGVWIVARAGHRTAHKEGHALGRLSVTIAMAVLTIGAFDVYMVLMNDAVAAVGNIPAIWASRVGAFAMLALVMLVRRRGVAMPGRTGVLLVGQSLLDTLGFVLLFAAEGQGGTALATVASSAYGVVTVVLARVFLKEVISTAGWVGLAMVFGGVVMLTAMS